MWIVLLVIAFVIWLLMRMSKPAKTKTQTKPSTKRINTKRAQEMKRLIALVNDGWENIDAKNAGHEASWAAIKEGKEAMKHIRRIVGHLSQQEAEHYLKQLDSRSTDWYDTQGKRWSKS